MPMTAPELADALEGRREGQEWRCRCPVHGGRSLCVTEKDGRLLLTCRAGCPQAEVIKSLREMGLWGGAASYAPPPATEPQDDSERKADRASGLWSEARPITPGDPVWKYLRNRGITLDAWPQDLRCHEALPYWETGDSGKPVRVGSYPAMLSVVRSPAGRPVALHRTYLTENGQKAKVSAPKKVLKVYDLTGAAVRLFPPREGFLAVCEGIEDALSAWILWQIPAWAVLGTSGMKTFLPPEDVREILIVADRDENGAGQRAGLELAQRLEEKGKAVRIVTPSGQKDVNGLLMKGSVK